MEKPDLVIKGRPVTKSYGLKDGRMYPEKEVQMREKTIANLWSAKYPDVYWKDKYLAFSVRAYYPDHRNGDLKNIIYLAEDALSGVAYKDDRQIIRYDPVPFIDFCEKGEERTEIFVKEVDVG